ncbi:MAG TPA: FlgD immunoglobulin-like domain containing protein, partial [Verrucomicrobiae bacterium]|nr:FlgD immunoglobulin-like domain containing protein [Verrucomicrobiae bacterium]
PLDIALAPPFPNPMRDAATIRYVTVEPGPVEIAILDVSGRRVRMLEDEQREPGAGVLRWDGRDERGTRVAPGVYLVHMRSRGRALSRRIVLVD